MTVGKVIERNGVTFNLATVPNVGSITGDNNVQRVNMENVNNNNTVNNITIHAYSKENLQKVITPEFVEQVAKIAAKDCIAAITEFIRQKHFNVMAPENMNVYIPPPPEGSRFFNGHEWKPERCPGATAFCILRDSSDELLETLSQAGSKHPEALKKFRAFHRREPCDNKEARAATRKAAEAACRMVAAFHPEVKADGK